MSSDFDQLTEAIGRAPSRRTILKLVVASASASAFGGLFPSKAQADVCGPGIGQCDNGKCCSVTGTHCCPGNIHCCFNSGNLSVCCGSQVCCGPTDVCCPNATGNGVVNGGLCCPQGSSCCGDTCCSAPNTCVNNTCVSGGCQSSSQCPPGQKCCNQQCVDTTSATNNCGQCGHVCPAGQTCVNGMCTMGCGFSSGCSPGMTCCHHVCLDTNTDPSNCGSCGFQCEPGGLCQAGKCVYPGCPNGEVPCGGVCEKPDVIAAHRDACIQKFVDLYQSCIFQCSQLAALPGRRDNPECGKICNFLLEELKQCEALC